VVVRVLETVAAGIVLWSLISALGLFALARKKRLVPDAPEGLRYVFFIPALNEGKVIGATVRHLLPFDPHAIVVIDDGSDDDTAARATETGDARVVLLRRCAPDARKGKGAALNHAFRWLCASKLVDGIDPDNVIVSVFDADGRLRPGALADIGAYFGDAQTGACQIAVRIRNRAATYWTRMQHFEFVSFTTLYQRGRERTGAVGLGGNGQFARLSALRTLGADPWTDCLVEDMDLGLRLQLAGWRNRYVPTSWVSQQAVPDIGRLLRQRTRWFQGTLQCLKHLPAVVTSELPLRTRVDLVSVLIGPCILLLASPLIVVGWFSLLRSVVTGSDARLIAAQALVCYCVAIFPALLLAFGYWLEEPSTTFFDAIVAAHKFIAYGYVWFVAGWRALFRQILRRNGWAKTARVAEPVPVVEVAA
jgi:1,2-diacylglycerol 3-beta-glucosyltransferase